MSTKCTVRWSPPPDGVHQPTPMVDLPDLARELGVGRVMAKNESTRLGLPAFKALGTTWALHGALARIRKHLE